MTWVKVDDQAHGRPEENSAWAMARGSLGLHFLASSYCGAYLTDGLVPTTFVEQKLPDVDERNATVAALLESGLWEATSEGFQITRFLDDNPSRRQVERERKRKQKAGRMGARTTNLKRRREAA